MEKAAQNIENELLCYRLLTVDESEKVGALTSKVQDIHRNLCDEVANVQNIDDHINTIKDGIKKINREQSRQNIILDQCEKSLKLRQNDVDQALRDCEVNFWPHLFLLSK